MTDVLDKAIGAYHFLVDKVSADIPLVEPRPRTPNRWLKDGKAIVARTNATGDIVGSLNGLLSLLGDISKAIKPGDSVLVKPNFNSPDPFPASTDLHFLRAVVQRLKDQGAHVTIGESAGGIWRPSNKVFDKVGLYKLARQLDVPVVHFDCDSCDWVTVNIQGDYLKTVTIPRIAYEVDKLAYLPCMKTHMLARFTGALKITVGLMHPGERRALHAGNLEQKVAEINLFRQPDLVIMDGRKAFVTVGPDRGKLVEPGILLASGDPVALDAEAIKVLLSYKAPNRLHANPWDSPQIATARHHGIGAGENGYIIVE